MSDEADKFWNKIGEREPWETPLLEEAPLDEPLIFYVGRQTYVGKLNTDVVVIQAVFIDYDSALSYKKALEEDNLFTYFIGATSYGEKVNED